MIDHQEQVIIYATAKRGPIFLSAFFLYLLTYDAIDVKDNDNLAFFLEAQIQVMLSLIGTVRKPSTEPVVLVKQ